MTIKLCSECRFFNPPLQPSQCLAKPNERLDFINGGITYEYRSAQAIRSDTKQCGPQAVWFEPKAERAAA